MPYVNAVRRVSNDFLVPPFIDNHYSKKYSGRNNPLNSSGIIEDWSEWLRESNKKEDVDILRRNRLKGLPSGNATFILRLETVLERPLTFRPLGRPEKVKKDEV